MSLFCRLKNLVHKGVLKKEDLDRIVIIPKEQEPCEDCISRARALKEMQIYHDDCAKTSKYTRLGFETAMNIVESLPSIQPKTGHWIRVTDKTGHLVWECDKCGWQQRLNTNFCPDCGVKMLPTDSEKE